MEYRSSVETVSSPNKTNMSKTHISIIDPGLIIPVPMNLERSEEIFELTDSQNETQRTILQKQRVKQTETCRERT